MFSSEIEMRFAAPRHPKGGVAPLRGELALSEYNERQKRQLESLTTVSGPANIGLSASKTISSLRRRVNRISAPLLTEWRASR